MIEVSKLMQNIIDTIETSVTADAPHGATAVFSHLDAVYDIEDLASVRSPTRKFVLEPTGSRSLVGFLGHEGEMTSVVQTFDVSIAYQQGKSALQLRKVICEDVDKIGRFLMKTAHFDTTNTGLERRTVEGYSLVLDQGAGGTAVVTIPVECRYTPSY